MKFFIITKANISSSSCFPRFHLPSSSIACKWHHRLILLLCFIQMRKSAGDILELLGSDLCATILSLLDDPADLVRVSSLSRAWYHFVVEGDFCKSLCLKLFPEVSAVAYDIEEDNVIGIMEASPRSYWVIGTSERNHKVYGSLSRGLSPTLRNDCIFEAIAASSTDHYPLESMDNTLEPRDRIGQRPSYWSSTGEFEDWMPAYLTYKLVSDLCLITEINIQPFQVYFHPGNPVYSAKSVRFHMGFDPMESTDNHFKWTYISPMYQMTQENILQKFKLPVPVLCIGGILHIEFFGRAQRCFNDLYYICVSHVQAVGRTLLPEFKVKFINRAGKCALLYSRMLEGNFVPVSLYVAIALLKLTAYIYATVELLTGIRFPIFSVDHLHV